MPFEISANPVAMNMYNNIAVHQAQGFNRDGENR